MNWYDSLPPANTTVPCGAGTHPVRWEAGRIVLPAHPDLEAELVLGALGGDKPGCVTLAETWDRHAGELAVLTAGPRSGADHVTVTWEQVAEQRAHWFGTPRGTVRVARPLRPGVPSPPSPPVPGRPVPGRPVPRLPGHMTGRAVTRGGGIGGGAVASQARQRFELLELLALGPAFQFRLSGTVAAVWAAPGRADDRASRRPELTAALTGRLAPAAEAWLGIDPDAVTVTPHEGPGWGSLHLTGADGGRPLRASLPVSWLSDVWAAGLAVTGGHLVVAVPEPGFPRARVLALPAPGAQPVRLDVVAGDLSAGEALPRWSVR